MQDSHKDNEKDLAAKYVRHSAPSIQSRLVNVHRVQGQQSNSNEQYVMVSSEQSIGFEITTISIRFSGI